MRQVRHWQLQSCVHLSEAAAAAAAADALALFNGALNHAG